MYPMLIFSIFGGQISFNFENSIFPFIGVENTMQYLMLIFCAGAQAKVSQLKKTLLDCRTLLQCKRDDLKRLWAEDLRYKKILNELQLV